MNHKYGLFVPVLHSDIAKPIRLRMHESDVELVHRMFILGVCPSREPRLFLVDSTDVLIEHLGDGNLNLTFTSPETHELAQRPSNSLIHATIGARDETEFQEGCYSFRELLGKPDNSKPTRFNVRRINWQDTTNPEVLRYIFAEFPSALLEQELERRRIENEQEAAQDAHDDETWQQEQAEYDEHQQQMKHRNRGLDQ